MVLIINWVLDNNFSFIEEFLIILDNNKTEIRPEKDRKTSTDLEKTLDLLDLENLIDFNYNDTQNTDYPARITSEKSQQ